MASQSKVYFFSENVRVRLSKRDRLTRHVEFLFNKEGRKLERMNFIFCTDRALREINKFYLGHDYLTDIITFNLSEDPELIVGESYISIERIRENAVLLKTSISRELWRVIFHGALHLCGFNDKSNQEKLRMRQMEEYYLSKMERRST